MDAASVISVSIFVGTLFLMIKRPRGIRLGLAAGIGALASLLLGTVAFGQALQSFMDIWDAALAFIGIVALSVTLDAMGFFKWAALKVVKLAGGSGVKLYFYVSLLTAAVSILFANDSAVLILTPIVLEIVTTLKIDSNGRLAYLFSAGLIADTAAMPLITSNPVNIVSADFFGYSFIDHLTLMSLVAVATITSSMLLVFLIFRKKIPKTYSTELAENLCQGTQTCPKNLLKISIAALVAVDVGYVFASLMRIPVSFIICAGAIFLIMTYWAAVNRGYFKDTQTKTLKTLTKEINWDIVLFMLSIFIVVQGLEHVGLTEFLAGALVWGGSLPSVLSIIVPSLLVTVGASFMNNWPMTILGLFSIEQAAATVALSSPAMTGLVFSNIIGNNLGPHFFPLGSLAILMWLETMRRKGVNISLWSYLKVGAFLSIVEVVVASVVLYLEISVLEIHLF
ncbi:MAG: ArsB/NhaD family transporter [Candidatus Bathyarchaeia archaeon]|jgi:arsenical pump membrane protein